MKSLTQNVEQGANPQSVAGEVLNLINLMGAMGESEQSDQVWNIIYSKDSDYGAKVEEHYFKLAS